MISRLAAGLTRHPAMAGAVLSLLSLPVHLVLPEAVSIPFAAVILGLVAGIYVGFALQDGRRRILAIEGLAALAFLAFALAGLTWSPWFIPAAYALHGVWDLLHHRQITTAMPFWYPPMCAVYDWVFANGLSALWVLR
jgi:hypothetical protein